MRVRLPPFSPKISTTFATGINVGHKISYNLETRLLFGYRKIKGVEVKELSYQQVVAVVRDRHKKKQEDYL